MKIALDFMGTAAVSMRSALKYRRNWNKESPTVKLLRTLMPKGSKGFRVYSPIGAGAHVNHNVPRVPVAVRLAVQRAGFRITDYLAKKCVKRSDKEQKNVFNIGKVISKDPVAKAAFDNDPQLQNSSTSEFTLVVSCHPYDIIGMSTGRDWDNTSCMRLKDDRKGYSDGFNSHYLNHDISEGTLVAYAIRSNDQNITAPLGRCLLKPFLRTDDDGKKLIMYRRETKIYGNPVPGMPEALSVFLRRLNAGVPTGTYYMNSLLYNDGVADVHEHDEEKESSNKIDWLHANEYEIFRDRPQMFPAYVEWMVKNIKAGEAPASSAETMIVTFAENVPARYVKQAARMIDDRDLLIAFADHMVLSSSGSDAKTYSKFCASKTFRKRLAAVADEAYMPESYAVMSHLSAKYAHKFFEEEKSRGALDDHRDLVNLAMNTIYGYNSLTKTDIESLPMLHSLVYNFANYVRAASVYGMAEYQENAHKYLSILAEPQPLPIEAYVSLLDYLKDDKANAPILFAMLMEAIKNGKANEVDLCLTIGFDTKLMASCLYERRMRRALLNQRKNLSAKGAEMLADGIAQVYTDSDEDENHNATSAARELTAYIQKNTFDAVTAENARTLQYSAPELIPYLFASGVQIDRENVITVLGNQMFAKAVRNMPRNESNKNILKIADTFVGIISPNTDFHRRRKDRPEPSDEFPAVVDPEVLAVVRKSLNDLPAYTYDLDKYPQLYSAQFYKEERPNLYTLYTSGKLQSVLKHMESEEVVNLMRAIASDLSGLSPVLAALRNDDRMLADSYAMTQLMGLMRSASKSESIDESAKTVQAVVTAVQNLEAMVYDVFPPVGAHIDQWRKVVPALADSEYPFADIAVKDMLEGVKMLKRQTRIFEMLDPELAQYYPDDWPKVTA